MLKDMLQVQRTGNVFAAKDPIKNNQFLNKDEYKLSLAYNILFKADAQDYEREQKKAEDHLSHMIYNDMIADVYELLRLSRDKESFDILIKMLNKMK